MNSASMILRIVAIVGALAAAALYFVGQGKLAEQKAATEAAEQATREVQAQLADANETIVQRDATIEQTQQQLANEKSRLENTRAELATARQEIRSTKSDLSLAREQIENLEDARNQLRSDMLALEQELASANQARADLERLNTQIAELEDTNEQLRNDIEELEARTGFASGEEAATGPTPVASVMEQFVPTASQPLPPARVGPETTIATVYPESGLIALSNTAELGLAPGAQARLVKDLKALASIQVLRIESGVVVADILPGSNLSLLSPGTSVQILR